MDNDVGPALAAGLVGVHVRRGPWGHLQEPPAAAIRIGSLDELPGAFAVTIRVGIGVDAHALERGVPLVLGGVRFDYDRGLAGHSDGDVLAHALVDAVLGAAGLGDIGSLFPSDDARYQGASSLDLLREAYRQVEAPAGRLVNADCILIGEQPRIAPHREEMRRRLSEALGGGEVNVRATTTDHLGFTGRGEGLAAQAVALLERA